MAWQEVQMARSDQARIRGVSMSAVAVFVAAALVGKAQAATLTVGPVEQVNLKTSTLVVLGQTYHISPSTSLRNQAGAVISLSALTSDTLVSIDGTETPAGSVIVQSVIALAQLDVPGATQLSVTGIVSNVMPTGEIKIGNLTVDINPTLTSDSQNVTAGELVEITGTQPTGGGLFLAQSMVSVGANGLTSYGIRGGGKATSVKMGIRGGGLSTYGIRGGGLTSYGIRGGGKATAYGIRGGGKSTSVKMGIRGGG